jgi:hypothetical protein
MVVTAPYIGGKIAGVSIKFCVEVSTTCAPDSPNHVSLACGRLGTGYRAAKPTSERQQGRVRRKYDGVDSSRRLDTAGAKEVGIVRDGQVRVVGDGHSNAE